MSDRRDDARLVFVHEPTAEQLARQFGPDLATDRVSWRDDGERVELGYRAPPFVPLAAIVLLVAVTITVLPWLLAWCDVRVPNPLVGAPRVLMLAGLWGLVVPTLLGLFWWLQRRVRRLGPGVVLDRAAATVALPRLGLVVPQAAVHSVVEHTVDVPRRERPTRQRQTSLLVRCTDGTWLCAPIVRTVGRPGDQGPARRLAELLGVRVQRVSG